MAKGKKKLGKFSVHELENPCKTLLANIRFASMESPIKTIAVTSTAADEGKTTVCTNLATAIASSGKRVLLMEGDMRRRSIAKVMGVEPLYGIYSLLSGACKWEQAVIKTEVPNLYFLDAEPNIPNPADVCSTKRFGLMMQKLREVFDYVVVDTPPVGTFIDAAVIGSQVDATALVLRERFTKREAALAAAQQLRAGNCNLIGTVMTFVEDREDEYYAYYTPDGKRVDKTGMVGDLLGKGDLADETIGEWARNMGLSELVGKPPVRSAVPVPAVAAKPEPPAPEVPENPFAPGAFKADAARDGLTGNIPLVGKHIRRP